MLNPAPAFLLPVQDEETTIGDRAGGPGGGAGNLFSVGGNIGSSGGSD